MKHPIQQNHPTPFVAELQGTIHLVSDIPVGLTKPRVRAEIIRDDAAPATQGEIHVPLVDDNWHRISDTILPCPFCGGTEFDLGWLDPEPPEIERETWYLSCRGDCDVMVSTDGDTPAEAVAKWNRRAS